MILVVHGWEGGDKKHRVCKLELDENNRSRIIRSYGRDKSELNTPTDMIVSREGHIFVPDHNNNRILLLDRNLEMKCESRLQSVKIDHPSRLVLDEEEKYLYAVEDSDTGNIVRLTVEDLIQTPRNFHEDEIWKNG